MTALTTKQMAMMRVAAMMFASNFMLASDLASGVSALMIRKLTRPLMTIVTRARMQAVRKVRRTFVVHEVTARRMAAWMGITMARMGMNMASQMIGSSDVNEGSAPNMS